MDRSKVVVPGTLLSITGGGAIKLGEGLYTFNGQTYASRVGTLHTDQQLQRGEEGEDQKSATVAYILPTPPSVPSVGQVVIGSVTRLTARYAGVDISVGERSREGSPSPCASSSGPSAPLATATASPPPRPSSASDTPLYYEEPFKGTLRVQDIWGVEGHDAPSQLYLAFRPGDLVRARIIGMGDASAGFLLSTAGEGMGVVFARCAASGEPLVPIAWNEMICPVTGIREPRKPARPSSDDV